MPAVLPNTTTTDAYPIPGQGGAQLGSFIGDDVFSNGYVVVANAAVFAEFSSGLRGQGKPSAELFLAPSTYPLSGTAANPLNGVRFRSAVPGTPGQVFGVLYYPQEAQLVAASEFNATIASSGGFTPPGGSSMNVQAVQAGNKAPGQTYTLTVAVAGSYIVEWGCAGYSESGLGDTGTISCSASGVVNFHGSTAGSGGDALDVPLALTLNQVLTFTIGGTCASLNGCWAKITQIA